MSIFGAQDIDQVLLSFLDIDDLRNLYQVNRYYRDKIDTIKLPGWIEHDKHFNKAIINGNLQICKYLVNKYENVDINKSFKLCCSYNYLDIAQWLYSFGNIDIHAESDDAYQLSCINGHLEVAKWLYSLDDIDIDPDDYYAFQFSCSSPLVSPLRYGNNHLEVAQHRGSIFD